MRKFNENDYELVKGYESHFTRAIKSRYCTGLLTKDLELINKLYRETLNRQANLSCGGCVLQMMTGIGRLYFAFKKELEERLQKEEEEKKSQNTKTRSRRTTTKNKEDNKDEHKDKVEVQDC